MKGKQESVKLLSLIEPVNCALPVKRRCGKMGIWSLMNFGKETVKKVCEISYGYSMEAVRKMDEIVRVKSLEKLGEYMADDEGRAKMVYFSAKFVKNASLYAFKEAANILIPGGRAFAKIFAETVREIETESRNNATGVAAEMLKSRELKLGSKNKVHVDSFTHQTPEDVLRFFMMMEFMGTRYLDSLLVSDHGQRNV
ncbi:uncharacterized protein LOC125868207 [Solanum stenotomum]|uniref:uncharacterized protein LOC125868207 n=1 Tax=Solanum stenotomum TaxID=172797 RepID=UPI0020D1A931|nr:uncharacterized protein LOC125868207 [Solanum stenotomum]